MTEQFEMTVDENQESSNLLVSSLRRILLAGIGAVVLAQEEIEDFLDRMVDRGEIADADARKLLRDLQDGRLRVAQQTTERTEGEMDRRVESVLSRLNIPSKSEIDRLNARIAELNTKVDQLTNSQDN